MAAKESVAKQRFGRVQRAAAAAGISNPPAARQEVIPAGPTDVGGQPKTITIPQLPRLALPSLHVPTNLLSWIVLLVAGGLWYISVMATRVFLHELWSPESIAWYTPFVVQIGFSAVERYLFAGVKNWFTIGVLLLDAAINAAGLFIDLLPRFFRTSLWQMIQDGTGVSGELRGAVLLITAIALGVLLAWSNDKLFSMGLSK